MGVVRPLTASEGAKPIISREFNRNEGLWEMKRSENLIEDEHHSLIFLGSIKQAFNVDLNFGNFFDAVGIDQPWMIGFSVFLGCGKKVSDYHKNKLID